MKIGTASTRRIPLWAYVLLGVVLAINLFYILARFQIAVDGIGTRDANGQCLAVVVRTDSPGEKAGIKAGDIILSIDGVAISGDDHLGLLKEYRAGDQAEYRVLRNSEYIDLDLTMSSFWSQHDWFYFILYLVILIISFSSLFMFYKKPSDKSVKLFFIYLQLFAIAQNSRFLFIEGTYVSIANMAFILSFNLFGIVLFHFHLIFPTPIRNYNKIKQLLRIIYSAGILIAVATLVLLLKRNYAESLEYGKTFLQFARWSIGWMGLTLGLALATAFYQFFTTRDVLARKQLRLVIIGSVFGLLTPIAHSIYPEFFWRLENERHLLTLIEFANAAGSYIMISFIFVAIFIYRLWDIEIFIRKAILYTIATAIILLSYLLIIEVVNLLALKQTPTVQFIILTFSVVTFLLLRDVVQSLIDRFFRRETYDSTSVVSEFEEKLAGIYQVDDLNSGICRGIDHIFHVESILFFRKKSGNIYEMINHCGQNVMVPDKEIEITIEMVELLTKAKPFSMEEMLDKPRFTHPEKIRLIVPLTTSKEPSGFIMMGNKLSEKSYTIQDIRVLMLLSRRITALYHTAALFKKDIERQVMLELERARIAQDMHDDVGASLTRISILSELAKSNAVDDGPVKPWLGQISETSRKVMEEMNQIIWALNPKNDTLAGLLAYLRRFTNEFFEGTEIRCLFILPDEIPETGLTVEVRRNIYLVVREALHNVVKHSGATEVRVTLLRMNHGFIFRVNDNGKGFKAGSHNNTGNGLINMKQRMKDIGGEFRINPEPGKGTEIELIMMF